MESQDYVLKLPLQQMALRKIAITLWNPSCCDSLPSLSTRCEEMEILVKKMQEKVPMIFLPSSLREELIQLIPPIFAEIQRWRDYHRSLIPSTIERTVLDQLCWTSQGTVDYCKTARRLLRLGQLDTENSYKLSCLYCFEADSRKFWGKLSEDCKEKFRSGIAVDVILGGRHKNLITFWCNLLMGDTDILTDRYQERQRSPFQYAFAFAALSGNKVATEYFFQKLSFQEKEASLMKTAEGVLKQNFPFFGAYNDLPFHIPIRKTSDVVCYLLSQMSKEEQIEIFKKHPFSILCCFLNWPWQDLFMDVVAHVWPFLSLNEYRKILKILSNFRKVTGFNYGKIFQEFFLQSPCHYRDSLFMEHSEDREWILFYSTKRMDWFESLFWTNNTECIKLVLRNVNGAEREKLVTSKFGVDFCRRLVNREEWCLVELFVKECTLSSEAKMKLKDSFIKRIYRYPGFKYIKGKVIMNSTNDDWKKFLQLIDNSDITVCKKRCMEELESGEPSSTMKKY